ncbi:MAG: type III pantothenate kinase [Sedimentisphaeraceae bacterium JB056]
MNIIAVDIGNSSIKISLFLEGEKSPTEIIEDGNRQKLTEVLCGLWDKLPVSERSTEGRKDGVIVFCSVKPEWSELLKDVCKTELDEKALEIGIEKDIPLPIKLCVQYPANVGVDRIVAAAAAYFVVESAVIVADIGTAITVDLVDSDGDFMGGIIAPGFELSSKALNENTAQLPKVNIVTPLNPVGTSTQEAINNGIYYSAVGLLETISRNYAEQIGQWPQMIVTGAGASILKKDCTFVDNWVDELVIKGIVLSYKFYLDKLEVS